MQLPCYRKPTSYCFPPPLTILALVLLPLISLNSKNLERLPLMILSAQSFDASHKWAKPRQSGFNRDVKSKVLELAVIIKKKFLGMLWALFWRNKYYPRCHRVARNSTCYSILFIKRLGQNIFELQTNSANQTKNIATAVASETDKKLKLYLRANSIRYVRWLFFTQ